MNFFKILINKKKLERIITFLSDNNIKNWNDYENLESFDKELIKNIISKIDNNHPEELLFRLRVELSNKNQLLEYIKELEANEEYEKCSIILKKISKK